jgi:hypothetical protein
VVTEASTVCAELAVNVLSAAEVKSTPAPGPPLVLVAEVAVSVLAPPACEKINWSCVACVAVVGVALEIISCPACEPVPALALSWLDTPACVYWLFNCVTRFDSVVPAATVVEICPVLAVPTVSVPENVPEAFVAKAAVEGE